MPIAPHMSIYLKKNCSSIEKSRKLEEDNLEEVTSIKPWIIDSSFVKIINLFMYFNSWEGIVTSCPQTLLKIRQDMVSMLSQFTATEVKDFRDWLRFTLHIDVNKIF